METFWRTALGLRGIHKLNECRVLLVEQDLHPHHIAVHTYDNISQPASTTNIIITYLFSDFAPGSRDSRIKKPKKTLLKTFRNM